VGAVLFNDGEKLEIVAVRLPGEEPLAFSMAPKSAVSLLVKHPKE
jgi:glucosylceramidase